MDEFQIKGNKCDLSPLLNRTDCISRIEVTPEFNDQTNEMQFSWLIKYKQAKGKILLQLDTNDGILTIPMTEICKTEISKGRITIYGKSCELEESF